MFCFWVIILYIIVLKAFCQGLVCVTSIAHSFLSSQYIFKKRIAHVTPNFNPCKWVCIYIYLSCKKHTTVSGGVKVKSCKCLWNTEALRTFWLSFNYQINSIICFVSWMYTNLHMISRGPNYLELHTPFPLHNIHQGFCKLHS